MTLPHVFVASSSEGLDVVCAVHKLLQRALNGTVEVRPWTEAFQLTKAYIESLERLLDTSDFAVMVLTPDDRTTSREAETASPRDNVVFELGLFFGRLGRDRCFLIKRRDLDLKLPSDLLGIEPASFSMLPGQDLETALDSACARIGKAIRDATIALPVAPSSVTQNVPPRRPCEGSLTESLVRGGSGFY
jgi:predicted nucleotide-binding protein